MCYMSVLICKNVKNEGPGTIEDFLMAGNIPYTIVETSEIMDITDTAGFDTLLMMGGPMSVNEADIYPYIIKEESLVRDFISKNKRILGVCLGAQIMARALGSKVYKGPEQEIGWYDINITSDALGDSRISVLAAHPKTGNISGKFKVFHWHGETFDVPEKGIRLAGSALYPNQAFRYGSNAYAFQFHIEVKKAMIYEWLKNESVDFEKIKAETEELYNIYTDRAHNFYEAFFKNQ